MEDRELTRRGHAISSPAFRAERRPASNFHFADRPSREARLDARVVNGSAAADLPAAAGIHLRSGLAKETDDRLAEK